MLLDEERGNDIVPRVGLMRQDVRELNQIADVLGWELTEVRSDGYHSYLVYQIQRREDPSASHRFARLYSQSTSRSVYQQLSAEVEYIFIHGMGFDPHDSFSQGCAVPVLPESEFRYVLTDWHMASLGIAPRFGGETAVTEETREERVIHIVEENPMEQIYTQLRALTSKAVAARSVEYHAAQRGQTWERSVIEAKAQGVAYLVQNAIDYYDNASTENITQRMLNLYYGTIALMEAEMLVYGDQYQKLEEIEAVTKNGHGMATFGDAAAGLEEFQIGVFRQGLFQAWLSHRGVDVSEFPDSKKAAQQSSWHISLNQLLYCIPELENILLEVDDGFRPGYLLPSYDTGLNWRRGFSKETYYHRTYPGSYVNMIDLTERASETLVNEVFRDQTVVGTYEDNVTHSRGWRVYVHHGEDQHHYDVYKTHKGLSASMVLRPLFGLTQDWEVYAVMILYALSIIVRYRPNLWAGICHGELDRYKAVFYQFSRVAERNMTQTFLGKLTGKRVLIRHPQGLI